MLARDFNDFVWFLQKRIFAYVTQDHEAIFFQPANNRECTFSLISIISADSIYAFIEPVLGPFIQSIFIISYDLYSGVLF